MIKRRSIEELKTSESDSFRRFSSCKVETLFEDKIVLGIDPGTNFMGYAVLKIDSLKMECLEVGVIKLSKIADPYKKLLTIFQRLGAVIDRDNPSEMALEAPFYGKNVQSMLKLGRAQGVAMAVGLSKGMDVFEYSPLKVKQSVTGVGRASKEQVAGLLGKMFSIDFSSQKLDATDALAVAVCHVQNVKEQRIIASGEGGMNSVNNKNGSHSSWKTFVNNNKDKIL